MPFPDTILSQPRPASLGSFALPRRESYFPSPRDWRDEVLYFLLPDRFSDGSEQAANLLDRQNLAAARPNISGQAWRWDRWAESGAHHWQGGTIQGIESKLGYLKKLGVTTIWAGPVFKQRGHLDTYHGYGIQDFLDVDPRFGTRADLVDLVTAAHSLGLRVILDIIFNHSGFNWRYPAGTPGGTDTPFYTIGSYPFGDWLGQQGNSIAAIQGNDDGVWPAELQGNDVYTRAGVGDLGGGDIDDPLAEHKRTDFFTLRDFRLNGAPTLNFLARCYKYWIALTDCDGFRIDTLKHVSLEEGRNFLGSMKEFAANLGKADFFCVGEIAGGDFNQDRYLDVLDRNLNAALDIGEMRLALNGVAKGLVHPGAYFGGFDPGDARMGSHRNLGLRHVSILDDHDHVFGQKIRFSSEAASDHQVVAGVALQLFTLGIPCVYYGTEQSFGGPEASQRQWLPGWKGGDHADRYLREAMFGPLHPRRQGLAGSAAGPAGLDCALPGFGPFGTAGRHCFDEQGAAFVRIAALNQIRKQYPVLRYGRQYARQISFLGLPFEFRGSGEILAWSRILDDEEALCVLNPHGNATRGADVIVDGSLNALGGSFQVVVNTAEAALGAGANVPHPVGSQLPVKIASNGATYVEIRDLPPSEVLVLVNHP